MKRLLSLVALGLPLLGFSCTEPAAPQPDDDDESLGTVALALDEGVIEPFMTTSFDVASRTLAGYDGGLEPYTGFFTPTTRFLRARVETWQPGDPCRELAVAYNTARTAASIAVIDAAVSAYIGCNASVRVATSGEIRSFRPIEDQPPPTDPCDDECNDHCDDHDDDCDDHHGGGGHHGGKKCKKSKKPWWNHHGGGGKYCKKR